MNDERRGEERIGESGGRERRTGEKEFGSVVSTLNRRGEKGKEEWRIGERREGERRGRERRSLYEER